MQNSNKKVWFQLSHEHSEDDPEGFDNILYTTHEGLEILISSLKKVSSLKTLGRHEVDISNYDTRYQTPFKIIELSSEPYGEDNENRKSAWVGKLIFFLILCILFLAAYGAFDLIKNMITE